MSSWRDEPEPNPDGESLSFDLLQPVGSSLRPLLVSVRALALRCNSHRSATLIVALCPDLRYNDRYRYRYVSELANPNEDLCCALPCRVQSIEVD